MAAGRGIAQGHDLGVGAAGRLGVALADGLAVGCEEDAAYRGVGVGKRASRSAQVQR